MHHLRPEGSDRRFWHAEHASGGGLPHGRLRCSGGSGSSPGTALQIRITKASRAGRRALLSDPLPGPGAGGRIQCISCGGSGAMQLRGLA